MSLLNLLLILCYIAFIEYTHCILFCPSVTFHNSHTPTDRFSCFRFSFGFEKFYYALHIIYSFSFTSRFLPLQMVFLSLIQFFSIEANCLSYYFRFIFSFSFFCFFFVFQIVFYSNHQLN